MSVTPACFSCCPYTFSDSESESDTFSTHSGYDINTLHPQADLDLVNQPPQPPFQPPNPPQDHKYWREREIIALESFLYNPKNQTQFFERETASGKPERLPFQMFYAHLFVVLENLKQQNNQ